nr:hypothetical protein BaRGS_003446 [Batillaria attramentaria]
MRVIHVSVRVGFSSRRFEPIHEIGALIACVLVIIISFIVIIALAARSPEVKTKRSATCGNGAQKIDPPVDHDYVNVFRDLDADEISAVVDYLVNQETLGITKDSSGNQILGAELYPPEKSATLAFLDSSQKRPPREALVTIAFTKETPPVVRQYVVGLLPDPNDPKINPRLPKDVLMKYFTNYKMKEASSVVDDQLQKTPGVKNLLKESFGATFTSNGCKEKCLITIPQKVSFALGEFMTLARTTRDISSARAKPVNTTTLVFDTYYNVNEFPIIHALPFQLIVQELDSVPFNVE